MFFTFLVFLELSLKLNHIFKKISRWAFFVLLLRIFRPSLAAVAALYVCVCMYDYECQTYTHSRSKKDNRFRDLCPEFGGVILLFLKGAFFRSPLTPLLKVLKRIYVDVVL